MQNTCVSGEINSRCTSVRRKKSFLKILKPGSKEITLSTIAYRGKKHLK